MDEYPEEENSITQVTDSIQELDQEAPLEVEAE